MQELIEKVLEWADNKGLIGPEGVEVQVLKMMSEVGEFADEVAKQNLDKAKMEMGDVLVTCVITSNKLGFSLDEALTAAYNKISTRSGKTVNGIFVKD